jgi:hypothetical protein
MTKRYHVNYVTGSAVIAVGLATDAFAISRIKNKPKITEAELLALNTNIIDPIDRWGMVKNHFYVSRRGYHYVYFLQL